MILIISFEEESVREMKLFVEVSIGSMFVVITLNSIKPLSVFRTASFSPLKSMNACVVAVNFSSLRKY